MGLPVKGTLNNFFGTKQVEKICLIKAPIVNLIIGEILWDPDDFEGQTHAIEMECFEDVADHSEELSGGRGLDRYHLFIKNQLQFFIGIDNLRVGL